MSVMEYLFWLSASLVVYGTMGYPVVIWLLGRLAPKPVRKRDICPTVTCVIAARNEERTIGAKLENLLTQDYPSDRLDIIVVSDGSMDDTAVIVEKWVQKVPTRVMLLSISTHCGKAYALNMGVAAAKGEIILFADARQRFDPQAVRMLVKNFADSEVGAVSGELMLGETAGRGANAGGGLYWRYEKFLRKAESRSGSMIGCTGAIYAVRRMLFPPLPKGALVDDVLIPMQILLSGHRVVFENEALAFDRLPDSLDREFYRKVRTAAGKVQLVALNPTLLNPLNGSATWRFLSHKLLPRVFMPYWLALLLLTNLSLNGKFYQGVLILQGLVYAAGVCGMVLGAHAGRLLSAASTFLMFNAAAIVGSLRYLCGFDHNLWRSQPLEPAPRSGAVE